MEMGAPAKAAQEMRRGAIQTQRTKGWRRGSKVVRLRRWEKM
jgi:hypothetical protein